MIGIISFVGYDCHRPNSTSSARTEFLVGTTAELKKGVAVVYLDKDFLGSANTQMDYHVFLNPLGPNAGLYLTRKSTTEFEVREFGRAKSGIFSTIES
jgi:hypothetical protein